jgi:hypothetical protein
MEKFEHKGKTWLDATSYSRNNTERKPTAWETTFGHVRIYITNNHIHYKGQWIFTCHALSGATWILKDATTKEEAADAAIKNCRDQVQHLHTLFFQPHP